MIEFDAPANLNGRVLHRELVDAGLPLDDEESDIALADGRVRVHNLTEDHRTAAQDVIDAHVPPDSPPDPNVELASAIEGASTLAELKDALLGNTSAGKAAGRPTNG